jgi:ATP-dependent DNA helicase RecQ
MHVGMTLTIESVTDVDLDRVLRERFGFAEFRPGQRESIQELLRSGSLLCIQPTGYGKSLLYQLPAALLDGMTLVISPLLALMRDQIGHLVERFGLSAASINSDQTEEENEASRSAAAAGRVRILFVAPEHLDHLERFEALARLPVRLLVVDEAHCISTWGHDFRPAYRQIVQLLRALAERQRGLRVLGLTATADARVEADVRQQLQRPGGPPLIVHRSSMDRPNLSLAVVPVAGLAQKLTYLARLVPRLPRCGLLYCATREHTEVVAEYLALQGLEVAAYHAGLEPERKRELQREFLAGRYQAIAATNALGMGIDKADLRYVVHVDVPGSITAYYQEVGRAGRDGRPARGILLFDAQDRRIQDHFIDAAQPRPEDFEAVLAAVRVHGPLGVTGVKLKTGLHPTRVTVVVAELVEQGFLDKRTAGGRQVYVEAGKPGTPELERYRNQAQVRARELEAILAYGRRELECLMASLRRALGDSGAEACGRCSECRARRSEVDPGEGQELAQEWLERRPSPIPACARPAVAEGLAMLDAEIRSRVISGFLRQRQQGAEGALDPRVAALLQAGARRLGERLAFGAVVGVPSRSWMQREEAIRVAAEALGVRARPDLLVWREPPEARQGELWNNDQRRQNVAGRMGLAAGAPLPRGAVLLLDDFVGSGATLREAARVLRKEAGLEAEIVPLTVARVRWRLGARHEVDKLPPES